MPNGRDMIKEAITEHYGDQCHEFCEGCACCDAWKAYEEMDAASLPVAVVKPLEWGDRIQKDRPLRFMVNSLCGRYSITEWLDNSGNVLCFATPFGNPTRIDAPTWAVGIDVLKAAAQAHHERRILSAITIRSEAEIRADERAKVVADAVACCTDVIKNYDAMKPDGVTYEPMRVQKVAKGMVSIARQDIRALHTDASRAITQIDTTEQP